MKKQILRRNVMALLLTASMLLGGVGCGKAESSTSAPSLKGSLTAQSAASAVTSTPAQDTMTQDTSIAAFDGIDLAQLRAQALKENPYANFAAAYMGNDEVEGVGIWPTDNATQANYDIFADIDDAHRIDISYGADDAETYCIFPADPKNGMTVSIVDGDTDEEKEEVYRSQTGEPVLIRCNGGGELNVKVYFTSGGEQIDYFWPMTIVSCGQKHLLEPNGGTCYDFTVYSSQPQGVSVNEPGGIWQAVVSQPISDYQLITMTLDLSAAYGWAELTITDAQSGDFMVRYSGSWSELDDKILTLDMSCEENCTGMKEYDVALTGTYGYAVGPDYSLTLSVGKDGTPFYQDHAREPIVFIPQAENAYVLDNSDLICTAVLNWYETRNSQRPGYSEIVSKEDNGVLVHLYDDMGEHISTAGWFFVEPNTMQGTDYMTGEVIDFSDFTDGIG